LKKSPVLGLFLQLGSWQRGLLVEEMVAVADLWAQLPLDEGLAQKALLWLEAPQTCSNPSFDNLYCWKK
jgi:hypothetical protein